MKIFLISNFGRVLNVVCFLLGYSPASEFCVPTFRNTLFHPHRHLPMKMGQCVPKRRHTKFRRRGITQKKAYNTLHVSDGLSVHHQESKTVHTASGICHTGSVAAC